MLRCRGGLESSAWIRVRKTFQNASGSGLQLRCTCFQRRRSVRASHSYSHVGCASDGARLTSQLGSRGRVYDHNRRSRGPMLRYGDSKKVGLGLRIRLSTTTLQKHAKRYLAKRARAHRVRIKRKKSWACRNRSDEQNAGQSGNEASPGLPRALNRDAVTPRNACNQHTPQANTRSLGLRSNFLT